MNPLHTIPTHPQDKDDPLESRQPARPPIGMTDGPPTDGELIGLPPTTFDGDRSKTDQFITRFGLYRILNQRNSVFTNPERRIALALTYISGPKVDDWVSQQFNALSTKVVGNANHMPTQHDDEALWEDFITEFKRAYSETVEEVLDRLKNLQMVEDEVEMYIATFENLTRQAGCEREGWIVDKFRRGLPPDFLRSIMRREPMPETIDEWQLAAREQVRRQRLKSFYMNVHNPGPNGDADAVQTGVIRRSQLSPEEKSRFMAEGRCFECSRIGHRVRECPDKLGENAQN